ncbi:hypothetical protein [Heyndrickxia sporothermodurans]|uniref:hypothetical protein n=1 Tax=Heyndrickxia sporothermodurans TaxID=46224 RepID=UPI002E1A3DD6|nr:hypothetical protein [Heyndrickxia sporothermodurans]MED3697667.1 hypothetical protein [Heyndrickxia sporothermodurans]
MVIDHCFMVMKGLFRGFVHFAGDHFFSSSRISQFRAFCYGYLLLIFPYLSVSSISLGISSSHLPASLGFEHFATDPFFSSSRISQFRALRYGSLLLIFPHLSVSGISLGIPSSYLPASLGFEHFATATFFSSSRISQFRALRYGYLLLIFPHLSVSSISLGISSSHLPASLSSGHYAKFITDLNSRFLRVSTIMYDNS